MANLPGYLAAARPVPLANRAPWYKTIAPAYIGVMLWFVFWQDLITCGLGKDCPPAGTLAYGYLYTLIGLIIATLICHFLFYLAPAMLGMQTGLPLYVVGTSTYGASGGLYMPGFLMGLLQFGWLAVNSFFVAKILCDCFGWNPTAPNWQHGILAAAFAFLAAFVGLKGIKYVGRVGTYLPLIPVVVLAIMLVITFPGWKKFQPVMTLPPPTQAELDLQSLTPEEYAAIEHTLPPRPMPFTLWQLYGILSIYIVGFFATAGAAGADIAMGSRHVGDVHNGGVFGILLPTFLVGAAVMLIVGGAYGKELVQPANQGELNPVKLMPDIIGKDWANWAMIALAISSFPGACFSSFIAANSFKTTMPKVNPFISVGIGALIAAILAVSGVVGKVIWVFQVIGASFGPVCGAMLADFLMSGMKWSGPRKGFNPAGWISWIVGFVVGAFNLVVDLLLKMPDAATSMSALEPYKNYVPVPPVTAFVVGFVLYVVLSVIGLRSRKLDLSGAA
jgi:cytosine permease